MATPLPDATPTEAQSGADLRRRRRGRNLALLVALLAMSGLFYAIALVKLGKHAANL
jgi:hypothetical protein